jgi:alpha-beta hydrolase superfamily lysophospholipase
MTDPISVDIAGYHGIHAAPAGERAGVVLFVHGAWGYAEQFAGWVRAFAAAGFDAYATSRRGRQGVPPARAAGVRFDDYVEDTRRVIDALGGDVIIVAHSMGALVALDVAAARPLAGLALLAPGPTRAVPDRRPPLGALAPLIGTMLPPLITGRPYLPRRGVADRLWLNRLPAPERDRAYARLVPESGLAARVAAAVAGDPTGVRCPVLCLAPLDDASTRPATYRSLARTYDADLREYPDHGHWLFAEPGWERIATDTLSWVEDAVLARPKPTPVAS